MRLLSICLLLIVCFVPKNAYSRVPEADTWIGRLGPGGSVRLGTLLGGSSAYVDSMLAAEYVLGAETGILMDAVLGFADTKTTRLHVGMLYRFLTGHGYALMPYTTAQLMAGKLFNVIGADLYTFGMRVGLGSDLFLTRSVGAGLLLSADIATTTGSYPTSYGIIDAVVYAMYNF